MTGVCLRLLPCASGMVLTYIRWLQNAADDVRLANPLARQERMGTGWFAVIMEYEGLVRDSALRLVSHDLFNRYMPMLSQQTRFLRLAHVYTQSSLATRHAPGNASGACLVQAPLASCGT